MKNKKNNVQLSVVRFSWLLMFATMFAYGAKIEKKVVAKTKPVLESKHTLQPEQSPNVELSKCADQSGANTNPSEKPTNKPQEDGPREQGDVKDQ